MVVVVPLQHMSNCCAMLASNFFRRHAHTHTHTFAYIFWEKNGQTFCSALYCSPHRKNSRKLPQKCDTCNIWLALHTLTYTRLHVYICVMSNICHYLSHRFFGNFLQRLHKRSHTRKHKQI